MLNKWKEELLTLTEASLQEADDAITKFYRKALNDIKEKTMSYIEEYETLSFSKRLEAERLLKSGKDIQRILEQTNKDVNGIIGDYAADEAERGYYGTWYTMDGMNNMRYPIGFIDEEYIKTIINQGIDGKRFSKRLHKHTEQLARNVEQSLLKAAYDGKGYAYAAKRIEDQVQGLYYRAIRIIRTEGGRVQSIAAQKAFEDAREMGLEFKIKWLSARDNRVRSSHRHLNGTIADEEGYFWSRGNKSKGPRLFGVAREDINCRCTLITEFDDLDYSEADSYEEWTKSGGNYESWLNNKNALGAGGKGDASNKTVFLENIDTSRTDEYIKAKEQIIRNMEVEHMYAVAENGNVYHAVGEVDSVNFDLDSYKNVVITHNHPPQEGEYVSFSGTDFAFLKKHQDIKEFRAVNLEYDYILKIIDISEITYYEAYSRALELVNYDNYEEYQHVIMEWLRLEGYIEYERIKR